MSLDFIPTVWAARLLTALEKSLVYGQRQVCNRDYEGEIREAGNTVKIASIGDVTIGDYTKDTDIADPEVLTDDEQTLLIDQQKYFNFYVDSIDRAQQNVNVLDEAMRRSAWALARKGRQFYRGPDGCGRARGQQDRLDRDAKGADQGRRVRISRRSRRAAR